MLDFTQGLCALSLLASNVLVYFTALTKRSSSNLDRPYCNQANHSVLTVMQFAETLMTFFAFSGVSAILGTPSIIWSKMIWKIASLITQSPLSNLSSNNEIAERKLVIYIWFSCGCTFLGRICFIIYANEECRSWPLISTNHWKLTSWMLQISLPHRWTLFQNLIMAYPSQIQLSSFLDNLVFI